jgi:hypothetical protein
LSTFIPKTPSGADTVIINNGFFPDLSLNDFRDAVRVDQNVSDGNAEDTMRQAMLESNALLAEWQAAQEVLGYATIDAVPGEDYGAVTHYQYWYLIAVRQLAKSLLIEQERDFDARNMSADKVDALNGRIDDCKRQHRLAISKITGVPNAYRVTLL